ncbi:MAG: hypothetical protein J6W93_00885, partial [Clostridia bacterium]|nr:hypothetical protein [Clostridia bacterium]
SVYYTEGFDPTAESIAFIQGIDADNENTSWGVVGYDPAPVNPDPAPVDPDPNVPQNGDAGIIALAVISVIALGGAVIVKKSK